MLTSLVQISSTVQMNLDIIMPSVTTSDALRTENLIVGFYDGKQMQLMYNLDISICRFPSRWTL